MNSETIVLKILVVGEPSVGKTCLLNRYCLGKFDHRTKATISCDFSTKIITDYNGKIL